MRLLSAGPLLLGLAGVGCVTDDDALAKRPPSGGNGGAGGAGGGGGDAAPDAADATVAERAPDVREAGEDVVGTGSGKLIVVHGVADEPRLRFCFERVGAGLEGIPQPPDGLAYAGSFVVPELPGFDPARDAVRTLVLAGDLTRVAGATCAQALAVAEAQADASVDGGDDASSDAAPDGEVAQPALVALRLPVLPAGTLRPDRDLLLVAAGCVGGPARTGPLALIVCGNGYAPDRPTLGALVVAPTIAQPAGKTALQVMNASLGTDIVDVVAIPASGNPMTLAEDLTLGRIAPALPVTKYAASELATTDATSVIDVQLSGTSLLKVPWPNALAHTGLDALANDTSYMLVLLGPRAGISAQSFWNGSTVTVVQTGP